MGLEGQGALPEVLRTAAVSNTGKEKCWRARRRIMCTGKLHNTVAAVAIP